MSTVIAVNGAAGPKHFPAATDCNSGCSSRCLAGEVSAGDRAEYGTARPAWAMLIREIPVRLLDFGRGGVLLETTAPLETGMAGQLDIATADRGVRSDDVRICRMLMLHGSAFIYAAGAEFLPSHGTGNQTLREVLDEMH